MALPPDQDDELSDEEFEEVLNDIGGRHRIYLVGDIWENERTARARQLSELVNDLFDLDLAEQCRMHNGDSSAGANSVNANISGAFTCPTASRSMCKKQARTIDSPLVVFVLSQGSLRNTARRASLRVILKDVRGRIKFSRQRPALLGLVYSPGGRSTDSPDLIYQLDQQLRSVFRNLSKEAVQTGLFVPKDATVKVEIKRSVCRLLRATRGDQTADTSTRSSSWCFLQCFYLWGSSKRTQQLVGEKQGTVENGEEAIPLQLPLSGTSQATPTGDEKESSV
ncbi:uncharacterized protein C2orf72 [Polypterus senegalus]|uniref:uncharacterized protein C2orf72 n=1 Tax=Polypterus senegalus TaxID=55291 RepID=UPI001963D38B|nr:uncharacterized protein C2orf72 [Polypterus senegalus]